jgi:hypothetical protein
VVELEGAITIGAVAAILCKYQHVSIVLLSERVVCPFSSAVSTAFSSMR